MTNPTAASSVFERLAALEADAFERFVCDAVAELLGVRIRRARSGYQAGRDGSGAGGLMIECKRYLSSRLSDRELVGELHAASEGGCDLWVLAATTEVGEQTASRINGAAASLGLMVTILDWPLGQAKPLEILVWAAPGTARRQLGVTANMLSAAIVERRSAVDRLRIELDSPLLSGDRLRYALNGKLTACLSDPRGLRDLGARPPASTAGGGMWSGYVDRPDLDRILNEWWNSPASKEGAPAVILGDEGVGKSLSALNWLRSRSIAQDLIFSISSNIPVQTDDPFDLLAECCRRQFGESSERWRRRLVSVLSKAAASGVRMLIYLDGINEQPEAPWVGLLKAFQTTPFVGTTSVLMSCRPWPYAYRFSSISALDRPPLEATVGLFTTEELRRALELHGRRLAQFPTEMQGLLARPRLLAMALRNEEALRAAGEYTVSRLFWEDWRDRISAGRRIVNTAQYRHALVHLARALDRRRVARTFTAEHGILNDALSLAQVGPYRSELAEQTFSEIVDGGLARLDEDLTLRLNPIFTALALGLELRNLLLDRHRLGTVGHLPLKDAAKLALEPWGGADFGASVARFAAWATSEMQDTPTTVRSAILAVWLDEKNFAASHREDAAAIVRRSTASAFEVAEDVWLREPGKACSALQRAFEATLAPDHAGGGARREMIARVLKWAGWISLERKVSTWNAGSRSHQREEALRSYRQGGGVEFDLATDLELCGVTLRIGEGRGADGDTAATLGLDTLVATGSSDLAPVVVATAVAGVVDFPEDLGLACIRMLRRLGPEDVSVHVELRAAVARLLDTGDAQSVEAADNLAFLLDLPRQPHDETLHPTTPLFWPGASPIFKDRLPDERSLMQVDEHLLREALLEMDANLSSSILEAVEARAPDGGGTSGTLDFGIVKDAAIARGLIAAGPTVPRVSEPVPESVPGCCAAYSDPSRIADLLEQALFAQDGGAAFDTLAHASGSAPEGAGACLLSDQGIEILDGKPQRFDRDPRTLSGQWIADVFRDQPRVMADLTTRLLDIRTHVADGHLRQRPGLLFGVIQAAFLLKSKDSPKLWTAATTHWQDYHLLPDRRIWYFDLPFEAPDGVEVDNLRTIALDAADSDDRLLDICLSVRRWRREGWLDARLAADLTSNAAWRVARAMVLQGMMGREPASPSNLDIDLAPVWLDEVNVAAFRHARREARMRAWIRLLVETDDPDRAIHAARVLEADADRRVHVLSEGFDAPTDRRDLLRDVSRTISTRDSHAAGMGLLQYFLGIHNHPWLGPPGLPRSPFI